MGFFDALRRVLAGDPRSEGLPGESYRPGEVDLGDSPSPEFPGRVPAAEQARLLRDVVEPFRAAAFDPRWRTADAVGLARGIYEDRAFDRLPLLADALMDAGCDAEQLLAHCRSDGPHVRGCWAVDLVLDKE